MTKARPTMSTVQVTPAEAEAMAALRRMGERVTGPRVAVIRVLAGTQTHLSAAEVTAAAGAQGSDIHLATAYRTLEALSELGLVRHTHLAGGSATYHLATPSAPTAHAHAQCRQCGVLHDVPQPWLGELSRRLRDELGFVLEPHHAAVTGLCAKCSERS